MKTLTAARYGCLVAAVAAAISIACGSSARDNALSAFREDFQNTAPSEPTQKSEVGITLPGGIVHMAPVEITAPYRDVHRAVAEQEARVEAEKFHFEEGGVLMKKVGKKVTTEAKLKFEPRYQKWDIIKFSW